MAKIVKMDPGQPSAENIKRKFIESFDYSKLTPEDKRFLQILGVKSAEDFLNAMSAFGLDENKIFQLIASGKTEDDLKAEDVLSDDFYDDEEEDEDEEYDEEYDGEEYDDDYGFPPLLPEGMFLPARKVQEYHIRIKLNDTSVKIWRELKVPSNMSLELLAYVLMEAMGWENEHFHDFSCRYGRGIVYYKPGRDIKAEDDFFMPFNTDIYNSDKTPLSDVLGKKGKRIQFEYDFGDSWIHDVWTKGIREYEPEEEPSVTLLKGHGQCPPESCGGVWGYEELLELMQKKRKTQDDKKQLEWYSIDYKTYDPDEFDLEERAVNVERLMKKVEAEIERRKKETKK